MHCHLIISRKDQANKKKLSPLTNHKNTQKGTITGGVDRVNLFQQAEQGFDKLFGYNRQQSESFDYHNTIKNSPVYEHIKLQELQYSERKAKTSQDSSQENLLSINLENKKASNWVLDINTHIISKKELNPKINSSFNQENAQTSSSPISLIPSGVSYPLIPEEQNSVFSKMKKKKKKRKI